jgi:hypothetical protein
LPGELIDNIQLDAIAGLIARHEYVIGIIPYELMPKEDELPAEWPSEVPPVERRDLIVVEKAGGATWTARRDGSLVTPNTPEGLALNSQLVEVSLQLGSLALMGNEAAELVAGMRQ